MKIQIKALLAVMAVAGLVGGLYVLRAEPEAAAEVPAELAAEPAAPAVAAVAASENAAPSAPDAATPLPTTAPDLPAFSTEEERKSTESTRRAALPAVLAAADRMEATVRDEIAELQRTGAPQSEISARQDKLRMLQEVRAKVLARNADVAPR